MPGGRAAAATFRSTSPFAIDDSRTGLAARRVARRLACAQLMRAQDQCSIPLGDRRDTTLSWRSSSIEHGNSKRSVLVS